MPPSFPRAWACVWSEYCFQAEFVFALSSSSGETVDRVDRTGQFHPGLSCWDSIIDIVELSRICLKPAIEPFAGARRIFLALRTWHICNLHRKRRGETGEMGDGLQSCQHSMRLLGMCLNIHPGAKSQWQGSKAWRLTLTFS